MRSSGSLRQLPPSDKTRISNLLREFFNQRAENELHRALVDEKTSLCDELQARVEQMELQVEEERERYQSELTALAKRLSAREEAHESQLRAQTAASQQQLASLRAEAAQKIALANEQNTGLQHAYETVCRQLESAAARLTDAEEANKRLVAQLHQQEGLSKSPSKKTVQIAPPSSNNDLTPEPSRARRIRNRQIVDIMTQQDREAESVSVSPRGPRSAAVPPRALHVRGYSRSSSGLHSHVDSLLGTPIAYEVVPDVGMDQTDAAVLRLLNG
ncbi:Chromosome partition protein Smc [Carpediemonas membranifera]|uniref:Chromosome partition protein Smc n=1 Tax=Carpediemonas membranifera TaxID=201153 RepID=A0A8J6E3T7_9EUKA|nr:Chromosome partition protein Smc [Carpediemonas membranifera]|eukprot:KAG9395996.1 Chromosome partition protein Smc [Carpediemonas membranifera]